VTDFILLLRHHTTTRTPIVTSALLVTIGIIYEERELEDAAGTTSILKLFGPVTSAKSRFDGRLCSTLVNVPVIIPCVVVINLNVSPSAGGFTKSTYKSPLRVISLYEMILLSPPNINIIVLSSSCTRLRIDKTPFGSIARLITTLQSIEPPPVSVLTKQSPEGLLCRASVTFDSIKRVPNIKVVPAVTEIEL